MDEKLLELLACPLCDSRPKLALVAGELVCPVCRHRFPILNGIPRLLPESARPPKNDAD